MVRICSVIGCFNSTAKLEEWYSQLCEIHGLHFGSCVCKPPFQLFPFPTESRDPEARRRWINLVNRKTKDGRDWQPTYQDRVCSVHFLESEPTPSLPDPTEFLGYDTLHPMAISKRKLPRDPPEESLPFRVVVEEIKVPEPKRKRKQEAPPTAQKKSKNRGKQSPIAIVTGMDENSEEQTVSESEPQSTGDKHIGYSNRQINTKQSECEWPDKVEKIKEIDRRVKTLKHHLVVAKNELEVAKNRLKVVKNELKVAKNELKVAKNELEVAKSVQSGTSNVPDCHAVFNVLNSEENWKLCGGTPARAETESHFACSEPEVGKKRYHTRNKGSVSWSTRRGKKASNAC